MKLSKFPQGKTEHWSLSKTLPELMAYVNRVEVKKTRDLVLWNVIAGICEPIDPFLKYTGDAPLFNPTFEMFPAASPDLLLVGLTLKVNKRTEPKIDWMDMEKTPEAVKFQISHRREGGCFNPTVAYELARIITPADHFSIIKSIQTELTFEDNTLRWPRGDSGWHTRTFGAGVGEMEVEWAIKMESLRATDTETPYQFRSQAIFVANNWLSETPGIIHPEISPWEDMIFLWGDDHYVRLKCPANTLVSLWIYYRGPLPAGGGALSCAGMLKAQTQIASSARAFSNITEMD